jgi:dimethylglycine dehydrogenase
MRLEKGYRQWKADLTYEYNPFESGLDRFVKFNKPGFIGKQALQAQLEQRQSKLFVAMTVDCSIAPAHGGDPVYAGTGQVGSVTSGGYGHRVQKNIAFAYVGRDHTKIGTKLKIGILGEFYQAEVVAPCLYDPQNKRVCS